MTGKINPLFYYLLSFTWGLPMTFVGSVVASVLVLAGYKPKRYAYSLYFEVGRHWGGVNLGTVFVCQKNASIETKTHEQGHGVQNCYFGPLMPFVVCIPSAIRYWYRCFIEHYNPKKYKSLPGYYSIWFEKQANSLGNDLIKYLEAQKK